MDKVSVCVICHIRFPWEWEDHVFMCANRHNHWLFTSEVPEDLVRVYTEEEKKPPPIPTPHSGW